MTIIYKVVIRTEWENAVAAGVFRGSAADRSDGFIHFSSSHQVEETVVRHFVRIGDLTLVAVRVEALGDALRWEYSRGGMRFPHLYADLPIEHILWAKTFDGKDMRALRNLIAE